MAATYKDVLIDLVSIDGDYGGRNVHMVSYSERVDFNFSFKRIILLHQISLGMS